MQDAYPVQFAVDFPDRALDRLTSAFRVFTVIPIAIVLGSIGAYGSDWGGDAGTDGGVYAAGAAGLLFVPPLLMIVFRQKYPRLWFDWNLQLLRFTHRVGVYLALMDDRYPSTDEEQSVHLDFPYPDVRNEPTGRYPRGLFDYVEGVIRWHNRVVGYAWILVTDAYPPFRLRP
jgi:hypothetical protein